MKAHSTKAGMSRRSFLKTLGVGSGVLVPGAAWAESRIPDSHDGELATLLDISKCIGCGECAAACQASNAEKFPQPQKPFPVMSPSRRAKPEDWSENRDVDDRLTPYNWLYIQTAEVTYNATDFEINIPRRCMHCQNPPCSSLCPFGAASKLKNGITRIHDSFCMGGAKCRTVCPWHIPQRQSGVGLYLKMMPRFAGNGVMYKCDRCYQLVEEGEVPACISVCPEGVQTIGPRKEIVASAKALADATGGFIYGMEENGGTNTLYVSPVPFDLLNKAVQKGKGRPHLADTPYAMADEANLAIATLVGPLAGIAAGFLGVGARLLGRKTDEEVSDDS